MQIVGEIALLNIYYHVSVGMKKLSEVGFEPTPTWVDQNTPAKERAFTLESGALDRSAILTYLFYEST